MSPWQGGVPAQNKVDPLTLLMGAMIGGGSSSGQGGAFQQLAGLAMANVMQADTRGGPGDRSYDRRERQVSNLQGEGGREGLARSGTTRVFSSTENDKLLQLCLLLAPPCTALLFMRDRQHS